jgi:hypothetical protein
VVALECVVGLLGGTGPDVGDELHEGLPQAPICLYHQGHEVVAGCKQRRALAKEVLPYSDVCKDQRR